MGSIWLTFSFDSLGVQRCSAWGGPHTARGNAITLAVRPQSHFPALLCMYSLSAANAGRAARLHQISYSVCEVTAELTATLNHWENINIIASIASFLLRLQFPCSSSLCGSIKMKRSNNEQWGLPCIGHGPIPEPDDFIGQQTVREQNGTVKAWRQPRWQQLGINSTSFNLTLTNRCEILTFNRINSDYFSQMRSKSKWEGAK